MASPYPPRGTKPWDAPLKGYLDEMTAGSSTDGGVAFQIENGVETNAALAAVYSRGLSVKDRQFGAVGDGVTDDTTAINACIVAAAAFGLRVYIPAGVYKITAQLSLRTGSYIYGEGRASQIKQFGDVTFNAFKSTTRDRITIRDLYINGNYQSRRPAQPDGDGGSNGIRIDAPDASPSIGVTIDNVDIEYTGHTGLMIFNAQMVQLSKVRILNTRRDGIDVWFNSRYVDITDCIVLEAGDDCISLEGENPGHADGACVRDVTIKGGTYTHRSDTQFGRGILIAGSKNVSVSGGIIHDTWSHGIMVAGGYVTNFACENVTISNMVIKNAGILGSVTQSGNGISVEVGITNISNCIIDNSYAAGILLQAAAAHSSVIGGTIINGQNSTSTGIRVSATCIDCLIEGVMFRNIPDVAVLTSAHETSVVGCHFYGCSAQNANRSTIRLETDVSRCQIFGNFITKVVSGGLYGIRVTTGTSSDNVIRDNINISRISAFAAGNFVSDGSTGRNFVSGNTNDGATRRCFSIDPAIARSTDVAGVGNSNQAIFYRVASGGEFSKITSEVTASSGNICVGFYKNNGLGGDAAAPGERIGTSGSIACPAVGVADIDLGATVKVAEGDWIAIAADNTTAAFRSTVTGESVSLLGKGRCCKQTSAFPLPTSAGTLTSIIGRNIVLLGTP